MESENNITVSRDYLTELEKKVEDLQSLITVSAMISSVHNFKDLTGLVLDMAKNVMDAEACSLLLFNRETRKLEFLVARSKDEATENILHNNITLDIGQGIAGMAAKNLQTLLVKDVRNDSRFLSLVDEKTGFITKSIIAVPLTGREGLIGVAEIINPMSKSFFNTYDSELFESFCRQVSVALENSKYYDEALKRERLGKELELAAVVQKSFLPEWPTISKGNLTVKALNISAANVGGDVYDFMENCEGKVGVLIGDVSGKGVSAALYMAKFISDFRYTAIRCEAPEQTLQSLNTSLSKGPRGMFITAMYIIMNVYTGKGMVAAAGHPPFLKHSKDGVIKVIPPSGPPLGIMPTDYPASEVEISSGESILFMTDGVFEAKNEAGQRIGFEKIVDFVSTLDAGDDLVESVAKYVNNFIGKMEMADDLTLVQISYKDAA
ncbi:MAG: SpoIIE family protein phosphatase [Nitrospirae bacterium]|nr:SpoIIE family protein phosphatase [Nitrospirota bacterium]